MTENHKQDAVLLIGFQNDYFADNGALAQAIEDQDGRGRMLANTVQLLEQLAPTGATLVSTPIQFTSDYSELVEPTGILKTIVDVGAFRAGERGSETIPEIRRFGDRILEIPGKRGLNAFSNTELESALRERDIRNIWLAGVVTSICIDSTGRAAHEMGFRVGILADCTAGRTRFEQEFYLENIFPLYASVTSSESLCNACT
jgi:nicotinamidase-related amidase